MKPFVLTIIAFALLMCLISCKEKNEDISTSVNKNGAIETSVEVKHLDEQHDLLITTHRVWVKNELSKAFIYQDTVPSLGKTFAEAENSEGDTKNVLINKAYEIFITVK